MLNVCIAVGLTIIELTQAIIELDNMKPELNKLTAEEATRNRCAKAGV